MAIIDKFEKHVIAKVIEAYLKDGISHRQIQREILHLPAPARGGGFRAMEILHYYNIKGDRKGSLKHSSVEDLSNSKDDLFLEAIGIYKELKAAREEASKTFLMNQNVNGEDRPTELRSEIKRRIFQDKLREVVLSNYNSTCAVCEINKSDLLICSHIKPWSIDKEERLNPKNTICFCVLHDKLFDRGYFSLNDNYHIIHGKKADTQIKTLLKNLRFKEPDINPPDHRFLKFHFEEICEG
jgi:hypothetical protein